MRIAIDLQGCQKKSNRFRGIGRYSLSLIKTLIRDHDEEFVLVANANLPDISSDFVKEISSSERNVSYFKWYYPKLDDNNSIHSETFKKLAIYLYSYAYTNLNADVILLTSFFDGFEDFAITQFDYDFKLPPIASIFYDLIPLLNPSLYLDPNNKYKKFYMERVKDLSKLDLFLAISESTACEIKNNLSLDHNITIKTISSGCNNEIFSRNTKPAIKEIKIVDDYGDFILYVGAADPRKNIIRLLEAYALLDKDLKNNFKLVLSGHFTKSEKIKIDRYVSILNISSDLIIYTGYISDKHLAYLYKKCTLFVMPSIHEGFGLPVLEAMSCGAAVIASNTTSLPEVLGNKEALFDPKNSREIASLITKCLLNVDFLDNLRSLGLERSKLFTWEKTAQKVYDAISIYASSKSSSVELIDLDWEIFKEHRKICFEFLKRKLFKLFSFDSKFTKIDENLRLVAASIDLINEASTSVNRKISKLPKVLNWRIEGPFDSNYSLAILNCQLSEALYKLNHNISINITEGNGDYPIDFNFINKNLIIKNLYKRTIKSESVTINSRNMYPPRVSDLNSRFNILHSYGWEETQINQDWIRDFNNSLQGITVMSKFVKRILIDNGFYKPIAVASLGAEHLISKGIDYYHLKSKKFKFLHISSCFPRKGIDILLEAYGQKFTQSDDVSLIIKTFPNPHNNIQSKLADFKRRFPDFPDVIYIEEDLSQAEIHSLYKQCDVLIAPSYGEGFGLPIAEAMLLKLPVLTTNWGGQLDFCNSENAWLIDYELEYSQSHFNLYSSVWAKPCLEHLKNLMSELFMLEKKQIQYKIDKAYDLISSRFTWENSAKENTKFLTKLLTSNIEELPKIGWVTTWNTRCGVASYSSNLIKYFSDDVTVLAPYQEELVEKDFSNVKRCWHLDDKDLQSLNELYKIIIKENFTSLVIQFNYGFYNFKEFETFIFACKKANLSIFIFLHSTTDPSKMLFKSLKTLSRALSISDRLLVHTPKDMNQLKKLDIVDNVVLFPHGILDFQPSDDLLKSYDDADHNAKTDIFNVATFGYCLPNKGFPELIKAFKLISEKEVRANLLMFTALYDDSFKWFYHKLIQLRDSLGLRDLIEINPNFLPDYEILEKLSKVDLIVFPYQNSNESSSAAVRQGISSGSKVVVTPLPIFEDVSKVVSFLPGFSVEDIASGILDSYRQNESENQNLSQINPPHEEWINQHRFSRVSARLQGLIRAVEMNKKFYN